MEQVSKNMHPKMSPVKLPLNPQILNFSSNDANNSVEVTAKDVIVNSSGGKHNHGSSKVKLKNIVDYNWEHRLYCGQLLAVHTDENFLAYVVKVPSPNNAGMWNGMVRVAHRSSEKRALLKGMHGQVQDLSFAFITSQVILACIDEGGNIFIHNIELETEGIVCTLMLHVIGSTTALGIDHRIVWCPYIPDEEDTDAGVEEDGSKLLVTTHGKKACIWNVGHILANYGTGAHLFDDISEPCFIIEEHTQPIIEAAFSPDGSALATASLDGYVMFFQVYEHTDVLRCLFKWSPHGGKPLSCLFFLDSHVSYNTEQFWKYAVTGCDNNSILKIWSCKSWVCLQTITFTPSPEIPIIAFKAGLDKSAEYLLLSDIHRRILFVLNLDNESDDNGVRCKSISEFFLPYPILSFGIVDAGLKAFKCPSSCADPYHQAIGGNSQNVSPMDNDLPLEDNERETSLTGNGSGEAATEGCNICAVIRLYLVQPKSLQEGTITFTPASTTIRQNPVTLLQIESGFNEGLIETSLDKETSCGTEDKTMSDVEEQERIASVNTPQHPLNTILAQQSQQLKNILMRAQAPPTGLLGKQPPSPLPPGPPFAPLLQPPVPQPPLNLMTPDAFNSSPAKRDDEDPPIAVTPEVVHLPSAPILDSDMQLCSTIDNSTIISAEQINSRAFSANPPLSVDGKFASGGSSPSREVQEILSLKGSDCFYEDDLEDDLNTQSPQIELQVSQTGSAPSLNNSSQNIQEEFQAYNAPESEMCISLRINHVGSHNNSKQSTGSNEKTDTVWPSINMEKINEANQRKANSVKSSSVNKSNNSLNLSTLNLDDEVKNEDVIYIEDDVQIIQNDQNNVQYKQKGRLIDDNISLILQKIEAVTYDSQKAISSLREEVLALRQSQNALIATKSNVEDTSYTVKQIEQAFQRNQAQLKQLVDTAIASRVESDRANREALLSGVSQIMGVQIAERLNAAVAHEARTTLVPGLERILEPIARSLQLELARTLSTTDHLLTENIQKLVNNKTVIDSLSQTVAQTLHSTTKDAFKDAIQTSLVPNMEKAQTQMFHQLNQTFNNGTKDYLSTFEGCTKRTMDQFSGMDDTCAQITSMSTQLQHILDQQSKQSMMNSQMQQTIKQLSNMTKDLQSMISKTLEGALQNHMTPIKECIREQINTGMAAHAAQLEDSVLLAVRSRTQTPAPSVIDMQIQQNQIDQLIAAGQTNAAFQQALSASDLRLVVHACASADPRQVFSQPCPLQQHVLLSLIQQLGADMNSDTQLKHRYLEEAVMNLDNSNPVTREHMPLVLKELQKQLSNFISCNPYNEATRNLKVLMLATEALVRPGDSADVTS